MLNLSTSSDYSLIVIKMGLVNELIFCSVNSDTLNPSPLCEKLTLGNYSSSSNKLTLHFVSDESIAGRGFDVVFVAIKDGKYIYKTIYYNINQFRIYRRPQNKIIFRCVGNCGKFTAWHGIIRKSGKSPAIRPFSKLSWRSGNWQIAADILWPRAKFFRMGFETSFISILLPLPGSAQCNDINLAIIKSKVFFSPLLAPVVTAWISNTFLSPYYLASQVPHTQCGLYNVFYTSVVGGAYG